VRLGQLLTVHLERPTREDVVEVPFRAVYGGGRVYVVEEGRMRGIDVESLGSSGDGDEERLLVHADALTPGAALVTTHMPNAMEGLRVEIIDEGGRAIASGAASDATERAAVGRTPDAASDAAADKPSLDAEESASAVGTADDDGPSATPAISRPSTADATGGGARRQ
jgi:hypothetical protein